MTEPHLPLLKEAERPPPTNDMLDRDATYCVAGSYFARPRLLACKRNYPTLCALAYTC